MCSRFRAASTFIDGHGVSSKWDAPSSYGATPFERASVGVAGWPSANDCPCGTITPGYAQPNRRPSQGTGIARLGVTRFVEEEAEMSSHDVMHAVETGAGALQELARRAGKDLGHPHGPFAKTGQYLIKGAAAVAPVTMAAVATGTTAVLTAVAPFAAAGLAIYGVIKVADWAISRQTGNPKKA